VAAAETAARSWLALADSGDYGQSWDQAAVVFQASISKSTWVGALGNARRPWVTFWVTAIIELAVLL